MTTIMAKGRCCRPNEAPPQLARGCKSRRRRRSVTATHAGSARSRAWGGSRAQHGGGMLVYGGASATLEQVLIANCTAYAADYGSADGGAIYIDPGGTVVMRDSAISSCAALRILPCILSVTEKV